MPKFTVRSIADSINWLQVWIYWFAKFGNRDKIINRKLYSFRFSAFDTDCFSFFNLQYLIEITDISCLERSLNSTADRDVVKRCAFRKMLFKNKSKLFLLGKLVYFFLNSVPKIRISNLSDEIIYRSHCCFPSLFLKSELHP